MQVVRTVLLAMSEDMGTAIKEEIQRQETNQLSLTDSIISLTHSIVGAVERYKPDILLISPFTLSYDSPNTDDELIESIYTIRANPSIAGTRIATILKQGDNDELISRLSGLNVWDIFQPENNQLNFKKILKQLCNPASIKNIEGIVNAKRAIQSPPVEQLSQQYAAQSEESPIASDTGLVIGDADSAEIESLKKELAQARRRESELASSMDVKAVDRSEYDELRKLVEDKVNAASLTDSLTSQFSQIMNNYDKQQKKLDLLSKTVKDQNRLLAESDLKNGTPSQLNELRKENSNLRQKLGQANSKISWLQANAKSQSMMGPDEEDDQVSSRKGLGTGSMWIVMAMVAVLLIVIMLSVVMVHSMNRSSYNSAESSSASVSSQPSFSTLLKEREYVKAAKQYPKRAVEAENGMLQDSDVDDKSDEANKISNYSNAEPIQLDNAYFNKDFAKVVDLWHESSDKNISDPIDERRVMISYSLMKCNKFSEAKIVAKPLSSNTMEKRIGIYQQFYNANKILENKLKNSDLSEKDQRKAKKQIEENEKAMEKL